MAGEIARPEAKLIK